MKLGRVESVWRYPVKGMRGEEVPYGYAGYAGLMGDRLFGVIAQDGDPAHPWHTGLDQEEFVLYEARFRNGSELLLPRNLDAFEGVDPGINPIYPSQSEFAVDVTSPTGAVYEIESQDFLCHLEKATDRKLRVDFTQKGQHDCRPLSIFSVSVARKLGEEIGMNVDKRRFRANFYVEWDNQEDPYFEVSLVGKTIKIGSKLIVAVIEKIPRCRMITIDPETSDEHPKLLRKLSRDHNGYAGVFAAVLQEGRVRQGDLIFLD